MYIAEQLKTISLPKQYMRHGKDCYLDPYRKRLIEITPEETVRQKILAFYESVLNVPRDMIYVEAPMVWYAENVTGRADIIIHEPYDEHLMRALAVIECKKEDVMLTDKVIEQVIRYGDIIGAMYIVITNGQQFEIAKYNMNNNQYEWLDEILSYKQMLEYDGASIEYSDKKQLPRFSAEELDDDAKLASFNNENYHWVYGSDSPKMVRYLAVNLYQCLMDTEHVLPAKILQFYEMVEDLGIRYMDYGNAGGGHYDGYFRSFLIKDRNNNMHIFSISLFGTFSDNDEEKRNSYTSLVIAIDNEKVSHNILQYNLDRFAKFENGEYRFKHNGLISGKKSADLKKYIMIKGSSLVKDEKTVELGKLRGKKLFYLDGKQESSFIYNLIEYSLLREEFRRNI